MLSEKELLLMICDKLGIEPESYYKEMTERKQSNCDHCFVRQYVWCDESKMQDVCLKCGKVKE